jgi:hypothetical protein
MGADQLRDSLVVGIAKFFMVLLLADSEAAFSIVIVVSGYAAEHDEFLIFVYEYHATLPITFGQFSPSTLRYSDIGVATPGQARDNAASSPRTMCGAKTSV